MVSLKEVTELDLIGRAQKGDDAAFSELVSRNKEKAMQMAAVIVGNWEDAKDVSQEAFVKAYHALKNFKGDSKFSTWFYRILVNTSKDHLRKKKLSRWAKWTKQDEMDTFFELISGKETADGKAKSQELGGQMASAIEKLPEKQKWVFTLRFVEDLSLKEIAEVTGQQEGTVKATLHFAVTKFKEAMGPYWAKGAMSHG